MKNSVVKIIYVKPEIALIVMEDRENKNTFTGELIDGIVKRFTEAENNPECKVIILTGFDSYFATGGTKEDLIAINEGHIKFTDSAGEKNVYSLPLECKLPVIAAMQGHAIGGGLALGLFGDFVIMSRESVYSASFMKYGFTPGFGATCIFPEKLGIALAEEFLITARTFRGEELAKRGIPFEVCSRADVVNRAVEMAETVADKPRDSLILLKEHLTEGIRNKLPAVIEKELLMHDLTFHHPEVTDRIRRLY